MINNKKIVDGFYFEDIVSKIFIKSGFTIKTECESKIDIIAENTEKDTTYYVEVKYVTSESINNLSVYRESMNYIVGLSEENNTIPVIVVSACISNETRDRYYSIYDKLIILDISNLLYAVQGTDLEDILISFLPYSIDQIEPKEGKINLTWLEHIDKNAILLSRLENCKPGKKYASEFEEICYDFLKFIFPDDLTLWEKQKKSNKKLYRFDLLCRITDNNQKTFWTMMKNDFHSKYIIFEFKNYNNKITQNEIYTTERYLYEKALRNVAIIIARNGFDSNSVWAAKGSLREYGKLILLITIDDLKDMYNLKLSQNDPSVFLLNKIDDLLAELEK